MPSFSCNLLFTGDLPLSVFYQGRGFVDRKLVQAPSIFIAGRPKAALLFWFFGDFRCGVRLSLFLLYINIKKGKIDVKC